MIPKIWEKEYQIDCLRDIIQMYTDSFPSLGLFKKNESDPDMFLRTNTLEISWFDKMIL